MAAEMYINKQSVRNFLSSGKNFLIPEYQRPYSWKEEQCETLWNDIVEFFQETQDTKNNNLSDEYFLGSIVGFINDNNRNVFEVIDGQQRITTLSLLFRAFYKVTGDLQYQKEQTKGYTKVFGKCLWFYDDGTEELIYSESYLQSKVILDSDLEDLKIILSKECDLGDNNKSLYAKNFRFFCEKLEIFLGKLDERKEFYETMLNKIVILPIECKNEENAMRIFTTLNDRGLPLADSDIIKGKIYAQKEKNEKQKKEFATAWKSLEAKLIDKETKEQLFDMNFLFIQYTHITRARKKDSSKEIGLRKFYTEKYREVLRQENLLKELDEIASFWLGDFNDKISQQAMQMFEVLECYPNEYWKYLVSAYYFYCKDAQKDFFDDKTLLPFLKKSITMLLVGFIDKPTVNAIKEFVFRGYTSIYENGELNFKANSKQILENEDLFKQQFFKSSTLIKALLTLNLYLKYPKQEVEISGEIEHIFPKTTNWRKSYTGWDKEEAKPFIESIGNKMWLEKIPNIKASNGYFDDKKEEYKKSRFLEAQDLAKSSKNDWLKEDIEARNEEIYQRLKEFFEKNL
ncbi:DUF262 domain-containing protein [Helicobacter sp. MIT 05-5293]|uniref:DUF262 domain-containing protein n=1 Tax=Helicobacter sp. MIT 05-5293 TaxID=1548149 RepID=UPI00051D6081|nr:DUF262 domain-containing protein [Helicobacter sp. MIT 05-5293]TLD80876.1 DUF262 domain-containing protein [Helicobacter sp. MIT 05-5293]